MKRRGARAARHSTWVVCVAWCVFASLTSNACGEAHTPGFLIVTEVRGAVTVTHGTGPETKAVVGDVVGSGSVVRVGANATVTIRDGDALELIAKDGAVIHGPDRSSPVAITLSEAGATARVVTGDTARRVILERALHEIGPGARIQLHRRTRDDAQIHAARGTMVRVPSPPIVRPPPRPVRDEVDEDGETARQRANRIEHGFSYGETVLHRSLDEYAHYEGMPAPASETAAITPRPNARLVVVDSRPFVPVALACPDSRPCVLDVYTRGRHGIARFTPDGRAIVVRLRRGTHSFHTHDRDDPESGFESMGNVAIVGTTGEIWGREMIALTPAEKGEIERIEVDRPYDGSFSIYESTPIPSSGRVPWPWSVSVRSAIGEPIDRSGRFLGVVEPSNRAVVVSFALPASDLMVQFVRHAMDEPAVAGTTGQVDPCLMGTWRLTPENALTALRRGRANDVDPVQAVAVTGGASLTFAGDGTVRLVVDALEVRSRSLLSDGPRPTPFSPPHASDRLDVATGIVTARYESMHGHLSRLEVLSATGDYATEATTRGIPTRGRGYAQRAYLDEDMTYDCRDRRTLVLDARRWDDSSPTWVR